MTAPLRELLASASFALAACTLVPPSGACPDGQAPIVVRCAPAAAAPAPAREPVPEAHESEVGLAALVPGLEPEAHESEVESEVVPVARESEARPVAHESEVVLAAPASESGPVPDAREAEVVVEPVVGAAPPPSCARAVNRALNPDRAGFPTPVESDHGWGGGADVWELVDGRTSYESWAHGLAFTGGHDGPSGGAPWHEPAGVRQATIDFGREVTFERVVVWNHGDEHTPDEAWLEAWVGGAWKRLESRRARATARAEGQGSGSATADTFTFPEVTARKLRYGFDNAGRNVLGTWNVHGWLYELEVWDCQARAVDEPRPLRPRRSPASPRR